MKNSGLSNIYNGTNTLLNAAISYNPKSSLASVILETPTDKYAILLDLSSASAATRSYKPEKLQQNQRNISRVLLLDSSHSGGPYTVLMVNHRMRRLLIDSRYGMSVRTTLFITSKRVNCGMAMTGLFMIKDRPTFHPIHIL